MHANRLGVPSLLLFAFVAACSGEEAANVGDVHPLRAGQSANASGAATSDRKGAADAGRPQRGRGNGHSPAPQDAGAGIVICGGAPCQCNNGVDDDGDGLLDGSDGECTGALDDDEATFATGIPGDNRDPKWQDCFFDGNSGAGDDRCRYPTECLTGELPQTDPACATTEACRNECLAVVPAGCDCFGCCTVQLPRGQSTHIRLSESCSLATIEDEAACQRCTPSVTCGSDTPPPADAPDAGAGEDPGGDDPADVPDTDPVDPAAEDPDVIR
jgi:hypothetical protein